MALHTLFARGNFFDRLWRLVKRVGIEVPAEGHWLPVLTIHPFPCPLGWIEVTFQQRLVQLLGIGRPIELQRLVGFLGDGGEIRLRRSCEQDAADYEPASQPELVGHLSPLVEWTVIG